MNDPDDATIPCTINPWIVGDVVEIVKCSGDSWSNYLGITTRVLEIPCYFYVTLECDRGGSYWPVGFLKRVMNQK